MLLLLFWKDGKEAREESGKVKEEVSSICLVSHSHA